MSHRSRCVRVSSPLKEIQKVAYGDPKAYLRLICKFWVEQLQFCTYGMKVVDGIRACPINHMNQYFGPLAMTQKFVAQPCACVSALQKPCKDPRLILLAQFCFKPAECVLC